MTKLRLRGIRRRQFTGVWKKAMEKVDMVAVWWWHDGGVVLLAVLEVLIMMRS